MMGVDTPETSRLTIYIYIKHKLCIKLVVLQDYIEMHGQQNKIQDFCFGILTGGQASSRTFLVRFILDIGDETN